MPFLSTRISRSKNNYFLKFFFEKNLFFLFFFYSFLGFAQNSNLLLPSHDKINIPLPLGQQIKGIQIPEYNEQGECIMMITASHAVKLNEVDLGLDNLKVEWNKDNPTNKMTLEVAHGHLDIEKKILFADSCTDIRRHDFNINADKGEFDLVNRSAKFYQIVHANIQSSITNQSPEKIVPNISPNFTSNQIKNTVPIETSTTEISSDNGLYFSDKENKIEFMGNVIVQNPQFDLTCQKLIVNINQQHDELVSIIAIGKVVLHQEKKNAQGDLISYTAKSAYATYMPSTCDILLEGWPQIEEGINCQVATSKSTFMILNTHGQQRTVGPSTTKIIDHGGENVLTP